MTRVTVQVAIIEGFSDRPTGKLAANASFDADFAHVPHGGDYIETGYGEQDVQSVLWRRDGSVLVSLRTIYTLSDSQEDVLRFLAAHGAGEEKP